MTLSQLCEALKAAGVNIVHCSRQDENLEISAVAPLSKAGVGSLSFLANEKHLKELQTTEASAVLISEKYASNVPKNTVAIVVNDPYYAYAVAARALNPESKPAPGIHPSAVIDESAIVADSASIGPGVVIGADCIIGPYAWIESHCVLGAGVELDAGVHLEPHVTLYDRVKVGEHTRIKAGAVIGSDGFGFVPYQGRWQPVPQLGRVVIGKRCSIGANVTIDRGALEDTEIGDDVIIDNLVHLAHNVKVGKGTAIVAQVGISGSTEIGAHCILAGQSATTGHLKIADGVQIMGRGVATTDIKEAGQYGGFPLMPQKEWKKMTVYERNLPQMAKELKTLKRQLADLQKQLEDLD